ncbi:MAG TPA: hypothetical protein VGR71_08670 [Nitrospira sp.]|nr:hypothetical protein [Nitrospira sp.]
MHYRESKRTSRQLDETALCNEDLITLAERELAAFARAVKELFGSEQAHLSASEWIDELESLHCTATPGIADFRRITTAVSARIAHQQPSPSFIECRREASQT